MFYMVDFQQLETYLSVSAAKIYAESCDKLMANLEEILWFCGLLTFSLSQVANWYSFVLTSFICFKVDK